MSELKWAIENGEMDKVKEIIENKGTSPDAEINGRILLHMAADYGQRDVLEYLIAKGADVNKKDKHGMTALLNAIFEDHKECVRLLLDKGAAREGTAPSGESYVEVASSQEVKDLLAK